MSNESSIVELLGGADRVEASDCYSTRFGRAWRGYSCKEVEAFLARTAETLDALTHTVTVQAEELARANKDLGALREMEQLLRESLISAQRTGEITLEQARRQAETMVEEARLKKMRLEQEATYFPAALRKEIEELSTLRTRLRTDLRALLDTHGAFLEELIFAEQRDVRVPGDTDHGLPGVTTPPSPVELPFEEADPPPHRVSFNDPSWLNQNDAPTDGKDILE
ncbi:MAG: DivIVA domain-containing protein [Candidatus Hydrogenedentes bacterium]|nr:DivIVA domain-containing protein [Candidatus Hydrogenedentota bacterium]